MARKKQSERQRPFAAKKPTVDELLASGMRLNRAGADFLKVDVQTALTFTRIALQTKDPASRRRNRNSACKAYDTVLRLISKVQLSDSDARILGSNLERLKSELRELGEIF